ncbi:YjbQ family protein [Dissulfurirhabdus thermomarina]|uniref:YjbQ family protein n=1 Tax=Dissulfurirhabdus thermomarina TaxID=1765737 RepID=A0A6N9TNL1_DISTH|nr:secondary thiamine-phosphate synthase enzyme YjbQ [Dissulfurirhabdus thermomarina]NDY42845.1 YjbQ family protein [Dissulfurirhabdus thermomarina]NMX23243.1 YjbQ family protein [Dissulfurirhabdus thermomarina]
MHLETFTFHVETAAGPDIRDITGECARCAAESGVRQGVLLVTSVGSTGSVTTIEFEPGAVADFARALERLAPPGADYAHEAAWHDGNGHSHVQAALVGPSLSVPVRDGRLVLGTWQQVVLVNHDVRPRRRRVAVTVLGTAG